MTIAKPISNLIANSHIHKSIKPMSAEHGLRKSWTLALTAKVNGSLPLGCYSVILSNCGGFSVMLPPIACFLKGLTNCPSGFNSRLLLRI